MNSYICLKPCKLGGVVYNKGDEVPAEAVIQCRIRALTAQGYIAPTPNIEPESVAAPLKPFPLLQAETREERISEAEQLLGVTPDEAHDIDMRATVCLDKFRELLGLKNDEDNSDADGNGDQDPPAEEFTCPVCQKVCTSAAGLTKHMKTHEE